MSAAVLGSSSDTRRMIESVLLSVKRARCRGEIPCKDNGRTSNSKKGQPRRGTSTHTEDNWRMNRGQLAHERSQNRAGA